MIHCRSSHRFLLSGGSVRRLSASFSRVAVKAAGLTAVTAVMLTAPSASAVPDDASTRSVGLMFDLGTLDGGMMSLVYRPASWLRLHAGGGTNGASPGVRAGAAIPIRRGWGLSLEGGHFFPGDLNGVFSAFAGPNYDDSHLLERFDYNFANVQLGWEIERSGLLFFVRAGVGYVWSQLPTDSLSRVENLSSLVDPDGSVEVFLPSLKLGFIGFL
jgi:hypothetical protein